MDDSSRSGWGTGIGCMVLAIIGIAQLVAGTIGLYYVAGSWGVTVAIFFFGFFKLELPFMIGTFICCIKVWGWPWLLALVFTLPGLVFLIPEAIASTVSMFRRHE